jgi:transposase
VIIDLTPIRDGTGPSRLLDMVEGRSKQVFKSWLADRPQGWRDKLEVVAMDGFTGFKTATTEELPDAVAVMDPFYAEVLVMPMRSALVLVGVGAGLVRSA